MSRRKDGLSVLALRVWRYLRDEGGWHRHYEVVDGLRLEGGPQKNNHAVSKALHALEARNNVQRHPGHVDPRRPHYGVTARCTPPEFETLTPSPSHKPEPATEAEAT